MTGNQGSYAYVMSGFPILRTSRLILRQIDEEDLQDIYHGLSHPDVIRFYGVQFETMEATKEQLKWYRSLESKRTGLWWAVCDQQTGRFLGAAGFNDWKQEENTAEIGFWLLPEKWGKGYNREVLQSIIEYAFTAMNLRQINAYVEVGNHKSIRSLLHHSFRWKETMTDCEEKDGRLISLHLFSLTRTVL